MDTKSDKCTTLYEGAATDRIVRNGGNVHPLEIGFGKERVLKIAIGFVLSFIIGAGCRYFDIPAASPPVIPGALIVLAMTLGYTSMDKMLVRKDRAATTKHLCGGPTGLPQSMTSSIQPSQTGGGGKS